MIIEYAEIGNRNNNNSNNIWKLCRPRNDRLTTSNARCVYSLCGGFEFRHRRLENGRWLDLSDWRYKLMIKCQPPLCHPLRSNILQEFDIRTFHLWANFEVNTETYSITRHTSHVRTYIIYDYRSKIGRDRKNVLIGFGPYLIIYFISICSIRVWFYLRRQPHTMSNRVEIVYYAMTIQSAE